MCRAFSPGPCTYGLYRFPTVRIRDACAPTSRNALLPKFCEATAHEHNLGPISVSVLGTSITKTTPVETEIGFVQLENTVFRTAGVNNFVVGPTQSNSRVAIGLAFLL